MIGNFFVKSCRLAFHRERKGLRLTRGRSFYRDEKGVRSRWKKGVATLSRIKNKDGGVEKQDLNFFVEAFRTLNGGRGEECGG